MQASVATTVGGAEAPKPPAFVEAHYLAPTAIARISRFRSAAGHDFSDGHESCRSMKHYLQPRGGDPGGKHDPSWTFLPIFAPFRGRIARVMPESWGDQLWLEPTAAPGYLVRIFHVHLAPGWREGDEVQAGMLLGHHASDETMSDVALEWQDSDGSRRLLSYFDAMPDDLFQDFSARGIESPSALVIPRAARDAAVLACDGERFREASTSDAALADWVDLTQPLASRSDASAIASRLVPQLKLERIAGELPFPVALEWGPAPASAPQPGAPVLYVATNGAAFPLPEDPVGAVWWLDDGTARPFLSHLDRPLGLLWVGAGDRAELLVSSRGRVAAWRDADGDGRAETERVLAAGLPAFDQHQNDSLALGPGGLVYVGMGTAGNADEADESELNGTIFRIPIGGGAPEVYAGGLRNPFDLAFGGDGRLWATDNGVDPPAAEAAPDELNQIVEGGFYGHPLVFGLDPPGPAAAARAPRPPAASFPAHASADGLLAYHGRLFPELRGRLLVAEFGSYEFSPATSGRRLVLVSPGTSGEEEPSSFASLVDPFPGRPLDVAEDPEGRIYIADFEGDAVWRLDRSVGGPTGP
jgi:glucose/arabinose dehydrogenase